MEIKRHTRSPGNLCHSSWWTFFFSACALLVTLGGCLENTALPPGGEPWPSDPIDLGDGGWNGGGTGGKDTGKTPADTALGTDIPADTADSSEQTASCPDDASDRNLALDDTYEVPLWLIAQETVFNDLFLSPGDRLYLFDDQRYCEIITNQGVPNFSPESGSYCATTPELSLRGWTLHQGSHFAIDNKGRSIFSVFKPAEERVSYPLPSQLKNPTGLVSDGEAFWISDGSENLLWKIDPTGAEDPQSRESHGVEPMSLGQADTLLYVLHGYEVSVQTYSGEICYTIGLPVLLAGFAIDLDGQYAYGVSLQSAVVYRFQL